MKKYINLLPSEQQSQMRLASVNSQILSFGIWLILSALVTLTILFVSFLFFRGRLSNLNDEVIVQTKVLEEVRQTAVQKEAEIYNLNLKNFETLTKAQDKWSQIMMEIGRKLPPDMSVDVLKIDRLEKKVEISGRAGSRVSVLSYRQYLIDSPYFQNINFPLSNLEKATNVNWKYRFYIKPNSLK